MKVFIAGSSGLIGHELVTFFDSRATDAERLRPLGENKRSG
jgi:hypothetical protein